MSYFDGIYMANIGQHSPRSTLSRHGPQFIIGRHGPQSTVSRHVRVTL